VQLPADGQEMDRVCARAPPLRAPVPGTSMACPQMPFFSSSTYACSVLAVVK
jgi:hypothetical protein